MGYPSRLRKVTGPFRKAVKSQCLLRSSHPTQKKHLAHILSLCLQTRFTPTQVTGTAKPVFAFFFFCLPHGLPVLRNTGSSPPPSTPPPYLVPSGWCEAPFFSLRGMLSPPVDQIVPVFSPPLLTARVTTHEPNVFGPPFFVKLGTTP